MYFVCTLIWMFSDFFSFPSNFMWWGFILLIYQDLFLYCLFEISGWWNFWQPQPYWFTWRGENLKMQPDCKRQKYSCVCSEVVSWALCCRNDCLSLCVSHAPTVCRYVFHMHRPFVVMCFSCANRNFKNIQFKIFFNIDIFPTAYISVTTR